MKTKNNIFLKLVSIFLILTPPVFSQVTGEHVEGGGNGLLTKIRQGRIKLISTFKNTRAHDLKSAGIPLETIDIFNRYAASLAQDLWHSEYRIYRHSPTDENILIAEEGDTVTRDFFIINGEEKSFKTSHEPFAMIHVNLPHCEEINMDVNGAGADWAREGRRHLETTYEESKEGDLKAIEDMALAVLQVHDLSLSEIGQSNSSDEERIVWTTFMYLKTFYPNVFPESIPLRFFVRELLDGLTADHIMTGKLIHRNFGPIEQPSKDFIELQFTDYLKTMGREDKTTQYMPPFSQYFDKPMLEVLKTNTQEQYFTYNKDFIYDDIPKFSDDTTRNRFLEALEIIKKLLISRDVRFEPGWHNKLLSDFLPLQSLNTTFKTSLEDIYNDILSKKLVVAIEDLSNETAASLAEKIAISPVAGENQMRAVTIVVYKFTPQKARDLLVILHDIFEEYKISENLEYADFLEKSTADVGVRDNWVKVGDKWVNAIKKNIYKSIIWTVRDRLFLDLEYPLFESHSSHLNMQSDYLDLWYKALPYRHQILNNGPVKPQKNELLPETEYQAPFFTYNIEEALNSKKSFILYEVGGSFHSRMKNLIRMKAVLGEPLSEVETAVMHAEENFPPMSNLIFAYTREEGESENRLIVKETAYPDMNILQDQATVMLENISVNLSITMASGMAFLFDPLPRELINAYQDDSIFHRYGTSLQAIVDPIKGIIYTFGDAAYNLFQLDPARTLKSLCNISSEACYLGLTTTAKVIRLPVDLGKTIYHGFQWLFSSEEENTCPSINWRDPPFEHASAQQMVEKMYMDFARTSGSERTVAYMEDQLKQLRNTLEK